HGRPIVRRISDSFASAPWKKVPAMERLVSESASGSAALAGYRALLPFPTSANIAAAATAGSSGGGCAEFRGTQTRSSVIRILVVLKPLCSDRALPGSG